MEVDVEDRPVERLGSRQLQAALQPSRRADDLAAAVLQQDLGHFGQQKVVLDDQDLQAFRPSELRSAAAWVAVWNVGAPAGMTKL